MPDHPLNIWSAVPGGNQVEAPSVDADALEIWGYCDRLSYRAGEDIALFVHTTAPAYELEVVRDGATSRTVLWQTELAGTRQATASSPATQGCGWQNPHRLAPTSDWGTGAFVVRLSVRDEEGRTATHEAFFVVLPQAGEEKRIAFILTTATWTAYNDWGGANHYRSVIDGQASDEQAPVVSRRRPWARGHIGLPDNAPRHADVPPLPRNATPDYPWLGWALKNGYTRHYCDAGWAYYERPFAHWAERQGYDFDILTQDDLHFRPDCLDPYTLVLLVGHDEYWSWEMRETLDRWIEDGGRLARFAGNMIWQVRIENDGAEQHCYRISSIDPGARDNPRRATTAWDSQAVNWPAAETFGLTGARGVYHRFGNVSPRASGGYTVYRPEHWALQGTDLYFGDIFGAGTSRILGYEVDGADFTFRHGLPFATGVDGAPDTLQIIAMAPASGGEVERHGGMLNAPLDELMAFLDAEPSAYPRPPESYAHGAAMMVSCRKGAGAVFNSGCAEWVSGLIRGDEDVIRITQNVINCFLKQELPE